MLVRPQVALRPVPHSDRHPSTRSAPGTRQRKQIDPVVGSLSEWGKSRTREFKSPMLACTIAESHDCGRGSLWHDSPIATFLPGFQVFPHPCNDVLLTIAALRCHCYCEPAWESTTAEDFLQACVELATWFAFEHAFGSWHLTPRDCGKFRACRELSCPSRSHICAAFDDWHCGWSPRLRSAPWYL